MRAIERESGGDRESERTEGLMADALKLGCDVYLDYFWTFLVI